MWLLAIGLWNTASVFLGGWKNLATAGILASVLVYGGSYVVEYDRRGSLITSQDAKIAGFTAQLAVANSQKAVDAATIKAINDKLWSFSHDLETNCKLLAKIAGDKSVTADKPVDPLVGNTLDALGKKKGK